RVQTAAFAERDHPLGHPPQLLRLGVGRLDLLVLEQRRHHVAQQRAPVGAGTAELAAGVAVPHSPIVLTPRATRESSRGPCARGSCRAPCPATGPWRPAPP